MLKAIENRQKLSYSFDRVINFAIAVNSPELNSVLDSILISDWGKSGLVDYTAALIKRVQDPKNPMGKTERQKVYAEAKSEFNAYLRKGQSNDDREAVKCLIVLHAFGDTMSMHKFIEEAFIQKNRNFNSEQFIEIAYTNMNALTDYQQERIIEQTPRRFASSQAQMRTTYFSAIEDVVDCALLKRLKKKYATDLEYNSVPFRCDK